MVYNYIRIVVINMKGVVKTIITLILIITFFIVLSESNTTYCTTQHANDDWLISTNSYDPYRVNVEVKQDKFVDKVNFIATVVRIVGIVIAVVALAAIGLKEMTSSVEGKSKIKEAIPGYLLGIVMVVSISLIPTIICEIMKNS